MTPKDLNLCGECGREKCEWGGKHGGECEAIFDLNDAITSARQVVEGMGKV